MDGTYESPPLNGRVSGTLRAPPGEALGLGLLLLVLLLILLLLELLLFLLLLLLLSKSDSLNSCRILSNGVAREPQMRKDCREMRDPPFFFFTARIYSSGLVA